MPTEKNLTGYPSIDKPWLKCYSENLHEKGEFPMNQEQEAQQSRTRVIDISSNVSIWICVLIIFIVLLDTLFVAFLGYQAYQGKLANNLFEPVVESSLLATGISIIGIAISVWAGLNIVNALERKEVETLKEKVSSINTNLEKNQKNLGETSILIADVNTQLDAVKEKQRRVDRAQLMNEMYKTVQDASTRALINRIENLKNLSDINLLLLFEIEKTFNSVYSLHESEYSYDEGLLREVKKGIKAIEDMQKEISDSEFEKSDVDALNLYLSHRMAELKFYSGYCCDKSEREDCFNEAIKLYLQNSSDFGAFLPEFNPTELYPNIDYRKCSKSSRKISAYLCNSIGESYSKIIQEKGFIQSSEEKRDEYGLKAVFYCAYAAEWDPCELYLRNLGCALERSRGFSIDLYPELLKIYSEAIGYGANGLSFKVLLSIYNKFCNEYLPIESIKKGETRKVPITNELHIKRWNELGDKRNTVEMVLSNMKEKSEQLKQIYPSNKDAYIYICIYYRYMCIIKHSTFDFEERYLNEYKKNYEILKIIAPDDGYTYALGHDLQAFLPTEDAKGEKNE